MRILTGIDEYVARWVIARLGAGEIPAPPYSAVGFADESGLRCGVIYHEYRKIDIRIVMAADSPKWATRGTIRNILAYPFLQLGCRRVTAVIAKKNKRSRRLVEGVGFVLEGGLRRAMGDGDMACLYGMLAEECRWLPKDALRKAA